MRALSTRAECRLCQPGTAVRALPIGAAVRTLPTGGSGAALCQPGARVRPLPTEGPGAGSAHGAVCGRAATGGEVLVTAESAWVGQGPVPRRERVRSVREPLSLMSQRVPAAKTVGPVGVAAAA